MIPFGENAFFRDTHLAPRFLVLDARLVIFAFLLILFPRVWTLLLFVSLTAFSLWIERRGMRMENAIRRGRAWLIGPYRHARGPHHVRQCSSFEWEASLPITLFVEPEDLPDSRPDRSAPKVKSLTSYLLSRLPWIGRRLAGRDQAEGSYPVEDTKKPEGGVGHV